jgi:adenosylmethionine-8-amino-7-oxononanoate aminotransferase
MQLLNERLSSHMHVGDIRGRGLLVGIEFVADRFDKTPFEPTVKLHAKLKASALSQGLLIYPSGGTVDGTVGDHILLAPPFITTEDDIVEIVRRLCHAIDATFQNSKAYLFA